jgi:hypothetical protein
MDADRLRPRLSGKIDLFQTTRTGFRRISPIEVGPIENSNGTPFFNAQISSPSASACVRRHARSEIGPPADNSPASLPNPPVAQTPTALENYGLDLHSFMNALR